MTDQGENWPRRVWRPYDAGPLQTCLEEMFGERTLADSPVRLAIPPFDQTTRVDPTVIWVVATTTSRSEGST